MTGPARTALRAAAGAAAAALLLSATPRATAGPRLQVAPGVCDLGSLIQGEQPTCRFPFRNEGDAELVILAIEPACGCTSALLSEPRLPPGGAGSIQVTFDSSSFSGDVAKEIAVRSNDPGRPETTLVVRAHVEPEVEFEPREVVFAIPAAGAAAGAETVVLVNRRAEPVFVRAVAAEPSSFACRIPPWTDRGAPLRVESWERVPLEVTYTPAVSPTLAVAGRCTLAIEGPRKGSFVLRLLALPR